LILSEIQKNLGILKRTWNVGIEGLRDKKEDVLAYSMKHITMKIERKKKEGRQPEPEAGELKAGFSKENN